MLQNRKKINHKTLFMYQSQVCPIVMYSTSKYLSDENILIIVNPFEETINVVTNVFYNKLRCVIVCDELLFDCTSQ